VSDNDESKRLLHLKLIQHNEASSLMQLNR
jgi:hypothetical protein